MSSLNPIGKPFIELPGVDSTNNYAMGLVREAMARHGTAVFAHYQSKGKGQRNKQWQSLAGENIALSLVLDTSSLEQQSLFLLSMAAALSSFQLINSYITDELSIKWPNDIYWRDRKAAGILIENIWQQGEWKWSVVGIGINVNQVDFGDLGNRAVSIRQVTGKINDPLLMAKELCKNFNEKFKELKNDPNKVISAYKEQLYKKNKQVRLKKGNRIFEATVKDVTVSGQLVVQHAIEEKFDVGEVEWIFTEE